MAFSPLPLINHVLWVSARRFLSPFTQESSLRVKSLETGLPALGENSWEKNPSAEKPLASIWFAALSLSTLLMIMYASVLTSLARQWWGDPNYGHGFFVPVFAGYVLWSARDRLRALPLRPSNFGFAIMLFAIGMRVLGMLGAELFITRLSFVILIAGVVLVLAGSQVLRSMAFPLGYLLFMIPLPAIVYYQLTLPLQLWASRLGAGGLVALGIHTVRAGNLLMLPNCTLNVVEACSGIRSLLSLLAAVVAYGYLAEPSRWKRSVLTVASIPIAIATNGLRLVATGVLSYSFSPAVDSGVIHLILGLGFFALAFLSIVLLHRVLQSLPRTQSRVQVTS
jgi:exosortase